MKSRFTFCLACLLLFAAALSAQTEFSADMVNTWGGSKQTARVYAGNDRVRIESQLTAEAAPTILDLTSRITRVVVADRKLYMEGAPGTSLQRGYAFFRVTNVEDACDTWQKLVLRPGESCRKIGHAALKGGDAVEYEGKSSEGDVSHVWLDTKLAFPVKWDSKGGGGELRNIQEGPQPSALFEIPADFQKIVGLSTTHHHAHP